METVKYKLNDYRKELMLGGNEVTADSLKRKYMGIALTDEIHKPTILELYEIHNNKLKELINIDIAEATHKRHRTSKSHVATFIKYQYGQDDLELDRIDFKFLSDYEHYFKTIRKCNHNSTMKYIKNLGKVIRLGLAEGYMTRHPFDKFKLNNHNPKRRCSIRSGFQNAWLYGHKNHSDLCKDSRESNNEWDEKFIEQVK